MKNTIKPYKASFWKIDPIPTNHSLISPYEIDTFGNSEEVISKLHDIPHLFFNLPSLLWEIPPENPAIVMFWNDVRLEFREEINRPWDKEVLTINALSPISKDLFYILYVQIHEQFNAVLLDELTHSFISPKQFKLDIS